MNIEHFLHKSTANWMQGEGQYDDIVMSTRIRLARNLMDFRFPRAFSEEEAMQIDKAVSNVLIDADEEQQSQFSYFSLHDMPVLQRQVLVEKHLISPQLADKVKAGSVLLSDDESISVMINEEDHIRIQCLQPGLQLAKAYENAEQIDRLLERHLPYAFDDTFGYLTSCPTNTGTGLRASIMMHLPALTMTNQIGSLISTMPRLGMVVRGMYGEGTESVGNYYQISNQITLGKSEKDILADLKSVTEQIIQKETEARTALMEHASIALADRLNRSLGTLLYARILTSEEAANCLSNVRLGIYLGIIQNIPVFVLNECMLYMQPGFLQQHAGTTLQANERDVYRASLLRERLQCNRELKKGQFDEEGEDSYDV
ncbi:protein arginine kinase [Viridibacillus sp. YIM B01967]|uniref:Protein-arginine kinase n=1 Tax=Viridibacillus soli TaxID=2798301 RepID=A0ABS1HCC2_9BACL|nr:protein arginine kinase [Viridibacillus soli]MBK3496623.1 protein arginine kinase [Viridibacillus soli]